MAAVRSHRLQVVLTACRDVVVVEDDCLAVRRPIRFVRGVRARAGIGGMGYRMRVCAISFRNPDLEVRALEHEPLSTRGETRIAPAPSARDPVAVMAVDVGQPDFVIGARRALEDDLASIWRETRVKVVALAGDMVLVAAVRAHDP